MDIMKLKNQQFGEFEFDETIVINFEDGLLGFEEFKKFVLITKDNDLFYWLTSIDEPELVFPIFPIQLIEENFPDFNGDEPFGIVRLDKDPLKISINLKAPVYLNQENNVGKQRIIDNDNYQVDYKLFTEN